MKRGINTKVPINTPAIKISTIKSKVYERGFYLISFSLPLNLLLNLLICYNLASCYGES
jgi:hypothetical protein